MNPAIDPPAAQPHRFDADTALEPLGGGRYRGNVSPNWRVGAGPNGGFIAALLLRALAMELDDQTRAPRSLTVHFCAKPGEAPIELFVTCERSGRSLSTLSVRAEQNGRLIALGLGAFSPSRPGFDYDDTIAPAAPAPADSVLIDPTRPGAAGVLSNYENHWAFGTRPGSGATGPADLGVWMRFQEPRFHDALAVTAYADALLPPPFLRIGRFAPAPTVDLTLHFATTLPGTLAPTPEAHCLVTGHADLSREGFFVGDAEVWSPAGVLLARARQHALLINTEA